MHLRVLRRAQRARSLLGLAFDYWRILPNLNSHLTLAEKSSALRRYLQCRRALLSMPEIYQPITIPGFEDITPRRACEDRLALITADMGAPPATVIDIGCQIGFFSFDLAKRGFLVRGIDSNSRNIRVARLLSTLPGASRPVFTCLELAPNTTSLLQPADYVLCLAVFHHIIYYQGLSVAKELISDLRSKTLQRLYFEIGQSNEPIEPWARYLPDMSPDPLEWISSFLLDGGFREIKLLGKVSTHLSDVPRYLVAAW